MYRPVDIFELEFAAVPHPFPAAAMPGLIRASRIARQGLVKKQHEPNPAAGQLTTLDRIRKVGHPPR